MDLTKRFIDVWKAWDKTPGNLYRANAMVDACIELADMLGTTTIELRRWLAEARRDGLSYDEAVEIAIRRL